MNRFYFSKLRKCFNYKNKNKKYREKNIKFLEIKIARYTHYKMFWVYEHRTTLCQSITRAIRESSAGTESQHATMQGRSSLYS